MGMTHVCLAKATKTWSPALRVAWLQRKKKKKERKERPAKKEAPSQTWLDLPRISIQSQRRIDVTAESDINVPRGLHKLTCLYALDHDSIPRDRP